MRKLLLCCSAVAAVAFLGGCSEEKSERGAEAIPDMFHTPAHKSFTALTTPDGKREYSSMLAPVEGTVPRSGAPYSVAPTDWATAKKLMNPLTPSRDVLKLGQTWYNHTCATCHGKDGNAIHGNVAKYFSGIPSINGANVINLTDGEIYHIISVGRARMPSIHAQLPPLERWAVTTYVRVLARATVAATEAATDVPPAKTDPKAPAKVDGGWVRYYPSADDQRLMDLKAIMALGEEREDAAATFKPLPEPIPEYVPPSWNEPGAKHGAGEH
jgi:mono/diheme cytochrome c family protein